jgi:phosphotransferase system HPr-like phosphotransfer protein
VAVDDQWGILHDGDIKGEYATKEAAFESAAAAASLAIREGHEVHLSVPGRAANESE